MYSTNHLIVLRILYKNNRLTSFTGFTIEEIIKANVDDVEIKRTLGKDIKPISVSTIRRSLRCLISNNLVNEGIKKEIFKKSYYITDVGINLINKMAEASIELKRLNSENKNK